MEFVVTTICGCITSSIPICGHRTTFMLKSSVFNCAIDSSYQYKFSLSPPSLLSWLFLSQPSAAAAAAASSVSPKNNNNNNKAFSSHQTGVDWWEWNSVQQSPWRINQDITTDYQGLTKILQLTDNLMSTSSILNVRLPDPKTKGKRVHQNIW